MPGRKATPTHLKIVRGNPGKRALPKNEPKASKKKPCAPSWLSRRGKQIFGTLVKRLEEIGVASASHTEALALTAMSLAEVEACTAALKDGCTYNAINTKGEKVIKARPEVAIRNAAARRAQSLLAEFGLSPASSTRVSVPGKGKDKDPWGDL